MTRLFEGLRVVDAASFIAGPVAATVLADFGADVIKLEAPAGDRLRSVRAMPGMPVHETDYAWQVDNRSKRGLSLDLGRSEGRAVLDRLLGGTDVLITNFLPRIRRKLGLDHADLAPRFPRLIYASMSAYGEAGPEAEVPGFDSTALWARSGMMDLVKPSPDSAPARALPGMGDHPSGLALLSAILMGLLKRERTGQGSFVSTSLVANGLWMNAFYAQAALNGAEIPARPAREDSSNALANTYRDVEGRWFNLALVDEDRQAPALFRAVGRADLLDDARFADTPARRRNARALRETLEGVFATAPLPHWRALLAEAGVTFAPVARLADLPGDGQLRHAGAVVPSAGTGAPTVGSPVFVQGEDKRPPEAAPGIGSHSREILREIGYADSEIEALIASGVVHAADPVTVAP